MRVTYDPAVDAAYIYLTWPIQPGAVRRTFPFEPENLGGSINLDFDASGRLLGLEVLGARTVLPEDVLKDAEGYPTELAGKKR